ncbi:hypothetical protein [Arthrobacter caoxuetaonis]|uniref:Capsular polysaccharide biosynthesis protein n=1 Tax=Arthrobacter caoxuetaonis TaxID=2886935 RepID=A0A9X1SDX8_9MICC|nr:hypothetical protein [Arthrobacter caoxuetaonis]MCC3282358.1 hypothetical protein [Arthrobacter caoxuetaonis]MCC3297254.1 hypothetical protein [Arthrobacter caoxuetaonis]USQ58189.1 hypothetical protein NF551_04965 [Arthrobacter caoxuetaonis]
MTMPQSLRVLVRRWYLVLFGLAVTGLMCAAANYLVPPSYDARGSMVLMPPTANVGDDGNPYLLLGGMSEALDVLVRQANSPTVRDRVLDDFDSATYTVEADRTTSGSIVVVQATADTEAASLELLEGAMQTLPATLDRMQDELAVTQEQRIDIMPVVVDAEAVLNVKQTLQVVGVAGLIGLSATFMVTALLDGLLLHRRERRAAIDAAGLSPAGRETPARSGGRPGTVKLPAPEKDVPVR